MAPANPPRRGEIYWVDWDPARGSEQAGLRPALVVSPTARNKIMRTVVVAALTRSVRDDTRNGRSPVTVFLPAGQPLRDEGSVLCFQILTASDSRLQEYAGRLTDEQMQAVDRAIAVAFGLRPDQY